MCIFNVLSFIVAHAAFYKEQSVLDYMRETLQLRESDYHGPLRELDRRKLENLLKGLKVSKDYYFIYYVRILHFVRFVLLPCDSLSFVNTMNYSNVF